MENSNKMFIGIDVSKASLDIITQSSGKTNDFKINNSVKEITKFLQNEVKAQIAFIAMENTGRYNWPFYEAIINFSHKVYVIPPLHLKKSLGLVRGKNDKIDAIRIVQFLKKNHQELQQWQPEREEIKKLKILLTERRQRIQIRKKLSNTQHDYTLMEKIAEAEGLITLNQQLINSINEQVIVVMR